MGGYSSRFRPVLNCALTLSEQRCECTLPAEATDDPLCRVVRCPLSHGDTLTKFPLECRASLAHQLPSTRDLAPRASRAATLLLVGPEGFYGRRGGPAEDGLGSLRALGGGGGAGCEPGPYCAGRAWGRRQLAPEIRPNKSVEGALGGVLAGTRAGLIVKLLFDLFWPDLSSMLDWQVSIPIGVTLCIVGIIGDLVESLLKRDADVKDTGALLPGMGGGLDRIDAPLLALPVAYYGRLAHG